MYDDDGGDDDVVRRGDRLWIWMHDVYVYTCNGTGRMDGLINGWMD